MRLHKAHMYSASRLLFEKDNRAAAARAVLRGVAFNPACLARYNVLVLVAGIVLGQRGMWLLQRVKHALRPVESHHS